MFRGDILQYHKIEVDGIQKVKCNACGHIADIGYPGTRGQLEGNTLRHHRCCNECDMIISTRSLLKSHNHFVHGIPYSEQEGNND